MEPCLAPPPLLEVYGCFGLLDGRVGSLGLGVRVCDQVPVRGPTTLTLCSSVLVSSALISRLVAVLARTM